MLPKKISLMLIFHYISGGRDDKTPSFWEAKTDLSPLFYLQAGFESSFSVELSYYLGCQQLAFLELVEGKSTWWVMAVLKAKLFKEAVTLLKVEPLPSCWDRGEPAVRGLEGCCPQDEVWLWCQCTEPCFLEWWRSACAIFSRWAMLWADCCIPPDGVSWSSAGTSVWLY